MGSSITVEQLFGNQPARLKFLRTNPTEAAQVQRVVARYAMAYPHVLFSYTNDGNETFARLKFLRTNPTEAAQVYAMAYPHVLFSYTNDGNETFRANGIGQVIRRICRLPAKGKQCRNGYRLRACVGLSTGILVM